jgi:hypothetical protein
VRCLRSIPVAPDSICCHCAPASRDSPGSILYLNGEPRFPRYWDRGNLIVVHCVKLSIVERGIDHTKYIEAELVEMFGRMDPRYSISGAGQNSRGAALLTSNQINAPCTSSFARKIPPIVPLPYGFPTPPPRSGLQRYDRKGERQNSTPRSQRASNSSGISPPSRLLIATYL